MSTSRPGQGHAPQAPPPPPPLKGGGGGGKGNGGGNGNGGAQRQERLRRLSLAETGIRNALIQRGIDPGLALRYSEAILRSPGVSIGKGTITYHGKTFTPDKFASSPLADLLTGVTAQKQNQAAIMGEPGYLQDVAELGFQRDTQLASIDDQRRRSLLNFGDPRYISDPTLAAEAAANPFSLQHALALQDEQRQQAVHQAANQSGTLFGGGYQSGQAEAGRQNAASVTSATQQLQDVLSGLGQQGAGVTGAYGLGQGRALLDATQRLESQGLLHAATPPPLGGGRFHIPLTTPGAGGGGRGGGGRPPRGVHQPGQIHYPKPGAGRNLWGRRG